MLDIKRFRKDRKIKQSEICEILSISQPFLSSIEKGIRPLNEDKFRKLHNHYGDIILEYKQTQRPIIIESKHIVDKSEARPIMINDLNVTFAPLIGQYAQAGYLTGFDDPKYLEKQPVYVAKRRYSGGSYIAFEIRGDSMDNDRRNAICDGDVALGWELKREFWTSHLITPKVYIIVHREEGILVKEIVEHDAESGTITCHSFNPDKARYPDFQLNLKDVQQLFCIKEISRENY